MTVTVSFKVRGWDREFDPSREMTRRINRLAGKTSVGSGYCFATGERDLDYAFRDPSKARAFVRAVRKIRGVRVA